MTLSQRYLAAKESNESNGIFYESLTDKGGNYFFLLAFFGITCQLTIIKMVIILTY